MKKYRIIKVISCYWQERYALEHRVLWFLWREKLERDIDGYYTVYETKERAEKILKEYLWKNKEEVVWYY